MGVLSVINMKILIWNSILMMIMIMSDDNRLKRLRGIGEDIMR
jgi:hypothetical protein